MKNKFTFLLPLILLGSYLATMAQCPVNIDFETGTYSNWIYYRGSVAAGPVYTLTSSTTPTPGMHQLTSGSGTDYYGGFPIVSPGGGLYSFKLGHDTINAPAYKARYYVHVPSGGGIYSLIYRYAVVLEWPSAGHVPSTMPRMHVTAVDSATGTAIPCDDYLYVSNGSIPGFLPSSVSSTTGGGLDVTYKTWTTGNLKFPGENGKTATVDFLANGCSQTGHFGYAYIDMTCGLFANTTIGCASGTTILAGPDGYSSYQWVDSLTFSTSYGSSQVVSITAPTIKTTYAVILTPYTGYGCPDTLYTVVIPSTLFVTTRSDTAICAGNSVTLTTSATTTTGPITYMWTPSTGLSCTTCSSPVATPGTTTTYSVTATDASGCTKVKGVTITVYSVPTAISGPTNVCPGASISLSDAVTGGVWTTAPTTYGTINSSTGLYTGISSGVATVTYTVGGSCSISTTITVNSLPPAIGGPSNVCQGSSITETDGTTGGTWTVFPAVIASIGGSTGVLSAAVTGFAVSTAIVTYTPGTGCAALRTITVNPLPSVAGTTAMCVGDVNTMSGTPFGGAWSAAPSTVGTITPVTGIFTSVGAGTSVITYTLPTGCASNTTVSVLPPPSRPYGPSQVCTGGTVTDFDTTAGGLWGYSGSVTVTSTGDVYGVSSGVGTVSYTIYYPATGSSCSSTYPVTVNPLPTLTGTTIICPGSTSALSGTPAGGTWSPGTGAIGYVGSTSGIATGVSAGSFAVTYVSPVGCTSSETITVSPPPAVITGPTSLCVGTTITLHDATTAGCVWSVSNGNASVSPGTVILGSDVTTVSGLFNGVDTIYYTNTGTGCSTSYVVTINTSPSTILPSPMSLCQGQTISISDAVSGGTYSVACSTVATVTTGSGGTGGLTALLTGSATPATCTITYSLGGSCSTSSVFTVNPLPPVFSGTMNACSGATSSIFVSGVGSGIGTWVSGTTATATVFPPTGTGTTVTAVGTSGTDIITFTLASTGCSRTGVYTVNPIPFPITGTRTLCASGGTTSLADATGGGSWTSSATPVATVAPSVGSPTTVTGGPVVVTSTATITYRLPTGCSTTAVVTVNTLPTAFTVTGGGNYCAGGSGVIVGLSGSTAGVTYQLNLGGTAIGGTVAGTGSALNFGIQTSAGAYTVVATNAAGCSRTMTGSVTVSINPVPTITGPTSMCASTTAILTTVVSPVTWTSSLPAVATIGATTGVVTAGATAGVSTVITCRATVTGCIATTTINVTTAPGPILGTSIVCQGLTDTLSNVVAGGTYSVTPTTICTIGALNGVLQSVGPTGSVLVIYTLGGSSCLVSRTFTVNPAPAAITGPSVLCQGTTITEADATPGGAWTSGNPALASITLTTGHVVASATLFGVDTITYTQGCPVTRTITVNPIPAAIAGPNIVCRGASVTLSDVTTGGGWSVSSGAATITGSGSSITLTGNAVSVVTPVTVTYTVGGCSSSLIVSVNPFPANIGGPNHVCQGSSILLTDATSGGGTWISSVPVTGTIDAVSGSFTGLATGTTTITFTSLAGCTTTSPVTVNTSPANITGLSSICVGATTILNDATAGGTWTSSGPAIAPIIATSGVITGSSPGSVVVSYTLGSCATTFPFTVVAPPLPIDAHPHTCIGVPLTLTDPTGGGIWSSGTLAIGTIDAGGTFTGIASGTVIITYGGTGCFQFSPVVVDPVSPIRGPNTVCVGQTIPLTDSTIGGTWSSGSTAIATVSAGGVVTGVSGGTVTITNTAYTGCLATTVITVNPLPSAITGPGTVCSNGFIGLSSAPGGGTWSSSNPGAGSIDPSLGTLYAGSVSVPTTVIISYTLVSTTGCGITRPIIIEPIPLPISGPNEICLHGTATYSDFGGGTWTSSTPATASIVLTTGVATGHALGGATITFTSTAGCITTTSVNVDPAAAPITGTFVLCQGDVTTLADASAPGTWTSSVPTVATINTTTGDVSTSGYGTSVITFSPLAGACPVTHLFTVNPLPVAISAPSSICPGQSVTLFEYGGGTWMSGDPTVATIGSTSGLLTGVAPISTTLTYTLATGCYTNTTIVVNNPPDPITGDTLICVGSTTTLSNATAGGPGTWSSSVSSVATVNTSGVVTGIRPGATVITYLPPGGCPATQTVHVNIPPTAIGGTPYLCQNGTTTLTNGVLYGAWTSSDNTIAGVDVSSGLVTGVITGNPAPATVDITYSLGAGCTSTINVTVNPIPDGISGPNSFCALSPVTFFDATAGTWSTSSPGLAPINPTTGSLTGNNPGGAVNVIYTNSYSCKVTYPVTVNPQPTAITGSMNVCIGTTSPLGDAIGGGTWVSTGTYVADVNATTGAVTGNHVGSCAIIYTINPGGCYAIATIYVQPLPNIYNVTGGGSYCAEGTGVPVGLDASSTGTNYLLYHGSTAAGSFLGTGSVMAFGLQTVAGSYHVVGISTSTGCSVPMAGTANVVIIPTVTPAVTINTPKDTVCAGTSALFTPVPVNGGTAPTYTWSVNGVGVGSGSTYSFIPANGDVVMATLFSNTVCPSPASVPSNNVIMTVTPYANPTVHISATPGDTVCKGTAVALNAVTTWGGNAPIYSWELNGMPVSGGTGYAAGTYIYVPANGDVLFVKMQSDYDCRLSQTDSSTLRMQVDTAVMPVVTISASPGTVLAPGQTGTFTATVAGSDHPTYQWYKNGYPIVGATTNVYTSNNFSITREDSLTCMVTNNGLCKITGYEWVFVDVSTVGVQQVGTGNSDFTVVPNPNRGEFTVKGSLSSAADQQVTLELTDVLGQVVYHNMAEAKGGKLSEHVHLANTIANGMYILSVRSGEESKVFHIVIEQ